MARARCLGSPPPPCFAWSPSPVARDRGGSRPRPDCGPAAAMLSLGGIRTRAKKPGAPQEETYGFVHEARLHRVERRRRVRRRPHGPPGLGAGELPGAADHDDLPWGRGGGTDATARIIAALLEKELGQPVNVVNRTGGNGVVGHRRSRPAAPDGYTIGLITVEISMMHWQGLTELTPAHYTPLALVNADPAGFQVRADSPYKTVKDARRCDQGQPAASSRRRAPARAASGIWRSPACCRRLRIDPDAVPWVPSNGAAPGAAGSRRRRRRHRPLLDARGARADRRRQGRRAWR